MQSYNRRLCEKDKFSLYQCLVTAIRVFLDTIFGVKTVFSSDLSAISLNFLVGHSLYGADIRYMQSK